MTSAWKLAPTIRPGRLARCLTLAAAALAMAGSAAAAGPVYWDWPAGRSFNELEHRGTALDLHGRLTLGLENREIGPVGPEVFWNLESDGRGGVYLGTGHGGEVYHLDPDGKAELRAQLEGPEVFTTLAWPDGSLLAGCGPDGQLYRIDAEGQVRELGRVAGGYIWAMARRPGSTEVWLAAGSPAAVYRLDEADSLQQVATLEAQNALALVFTAEDELLLGTQGPGLLYRLDPDRPERSEVLFQTPQDEVRQFISVPGQGLFFLSLNSGDQEGASGGNGNGKKNGSAPAGFMSLFDVEVEPVVPRAALFRLGNDGDVAPVWTADLDLMIASWSESWGWLAGGAVDEDQGYSLLHRLVPPAGHHVVSRWDGGDILDIQVMPRSGDTDRILVAQAHPGAVREVGRLTGAAAVAVSPPLDGKLRVHWGRLRWTGDQGLRWSVRGGNRAEPDASWTDWSDAWTDRDRALDLEPCRFLQWKVELPADGTRPGSGPTVTEVSVSAWQDNIPPVIRDLVLEQVSDISLGGMMNGSDNVTQTFRSGLKAEYSRSSQQDRSAEGQRAAQTRPLRVFTWQGDDPNGDRLVYRLEYARQGEHSWREIIERTEETIGSWDTSTVPDGRYRVRLTASDEQDNPADQALTAARESGPITVDNTPPVIRDFAIKPAGEGFHVVLQAEDEASSLAGAVIELPDGSRQRLDPVDRICDSRRERFDTRISWPLPGGPAGGPVWAVRVEVRDLAGNLAAVQGELTVEGER